MARKGTPYRADSSIESNRGGAYVVKRVVLCVALLAVSCIPAVFVNSLIGYFPALFLAALIVASFAYCQACRRAFSYDELASALSCVRGGTIDMLLRMRNASFLYIPRVQVEFSVRDIFGTVISADSVTVAINPHVDQDFTFTLSFGHIGEFEVGLSGLIISDPLGLFRRKVPVASSCSIVVTPRLREVDDIPLSDAAVKQVSEALRPSNLPGSDYCGVRDYAQGDPLKLIHWKLSARAGTYLTKLFEEQSDPSLDVYLDMSAPPLDAETLMSVYDAALETALSLEAHARERGLDTRLVFLNDKGEADQFVLTAGCDFRDLVTAVSFASAAPSDRFERLLCERATGLQSADNVAVCSANCTDGLVEALARIRATQRNVLLFVLSSADSGQRDGKLIQPSMRTLREAGIQAYSVCVDGGGV